MSEQALAEESNIVAFPKQPEIPEPGTGIEKDAKVDYKAWFILQTVPPQLIVVGRIEENTFGEVQIRTISNELVGQARMQLPRVPVPCDDVGSFFLSCLHRLGLNLVAELADHHRQKIVEPAKKLIVPNHVIPAPSGVR